jgi:kumamolisin
MRATADVSMDADPNTGYAILDEGDWIQIGGTSVSTPDWAGLWILAVDAAGQRLGPANPTLYRIANSPEYANVFTDVITGDNGRSIGPGYSAGKGWDNPTGWGVPHGGALVDWLLADARAGNSSSPTNGQSTNKSPVPPQVITPNLPGAQAKPL